MNNTFIEIWDNDSLQKNAIQIIKNKSLYLLNFNSNLFISYDNKSISIYKKINNLIVYQLATVLSLDFNNISN